MSDVAENGVLSDYLTTEQLAAELGVSPKTLRSWRSLGEAPVATRLGPHFVRFKRADVRTWLDGRKSGEAANGTA